MKHVILNNFAKEIIKHVQIDFVEPIQNFNLIDSNNPILNLFLHN